MAGKWFKVGAVVVVAAMVGGVLVARASDATQGAHYVGVAKCRICHSGGHGMNQYDTWMETKMSHAFDALQGSERSNPDCVKCHTTGYGKQGGFKDEKSTPQMENVQCEDCHGPGSDHIAAAAKNLGNTGPWEKHINKNPGGACVGCHNIHVNWKEKAAQLRAKAKAG